MVNTVHRVVANRADKDSIISTEYRVDIHIGNGIWMQRNVLVLLKNVHSY